MDYSPPGSSVHGILQAIPEWVAISFSRGYSQPRDRIHVSCIARELFPTKPPGKTLYTIEWDKESPQVLSRCSVYVQHVSDLLLCSPTCNGTFVSCVCFIKCRYFYLRGISKTILFCIYLNIRSDQISRSVMSDSLRPHELQHARPPCPSPTPRVHWDSRPLSQWCHPAISSSVILISCNHKLSTAWNCPTGLISETHWLFVSLPLPWFFGHKF